MSEFEINTLDALLELYDAEPVEASKRKVAPVLTAVYRKVVEAAPFCIVATSGIDGLDCSPRGDGSGFVRVVDDKTLLMPDRRGNNRLDTLRNIINDPKIALIFLIPGMNETLRIRGTATLSVDPDLMQSFAINGKLPKSVIKISIEAVYFQCARALIRSSLWDEATKVDRKTLPSAGEMTKSTWAEFDAEPYDAALHKRQLGSLY